MKTLLTTAATALVLGTTAYAESHSMGMGGYEITADDFYATNLIGMRIYSSEQELGENGDPINFAEQEWDDIGEINDLIVSEDGAIQAVIVGVGGFLGIGEKDVAITMDQVRTYDDENGERFLIVNSSQEALEAAPGFERATEAAMTDGEAAEPGMVEETGLSDATEAEAMAVPAAGETTTTDMEPVEAEAEAEMTTEAAVEEEMGEAEAEIAEVEAEAEAEMAEVEAEAEAAMGEAEAEMAEVEAEAEAEMGEAEAEMADTGAAAGGMVELEGYTTTAVADLSTDELTGAAVYGTNDDNIGEIEDLVASESGDITQAVIGVGGFLGLGEKKVAVDFEDLQILTNEDGSDIRVYISATEDALKELPEYEAPEEAAEMEAGAEAGAETEMGTEAEMGAETEMEGEAEMEAEPEMETEPAAQ